MKYILRVALIGTLCLAGIALADQEVQGPSEAEVKISELASLPDGLEVTHSPDIVDNQFLGPSGTQWAHKTTVSSTVGPVTIVEYGFLLERDGRWVAENWIRSKYSASDFEEDYDSPGAQLQPGESYTNEWNRSMSDNRPERTGKWYFIGVDAEGNRVKGEADLKLLGDMTDDGC